MKKDKHITVNMTEAEYNAIQKIAEYTRRSIADAAALILIDNAMELFIQYQQHDPAMTPARYIPAKKIK